MKEDLTFVVDSLGVARPEKIIEAPSHSLPELFAQGGMGGMILLIIQPPTTMIKLLNQAAHWRCEELIQASGMAKQKRRVAQSLPCRPRQRSRQ